MNHSLRVTPTGRPYRFGPDTHNATVRHRNVDETPLIIALGLTLFVLAALVWCCLSPSVRTRAIRSGYADHDPEATVGSVHPLTIMSSGQNTKEVSRPTHIRTCSVILPQPVYEPIQHGISFANYGTGNPQRSEYIRGHRLSSLPSLYLPPYRRDAGSSALVQHDLHPPPEYSSPPGSPPTQESTSSISYTTVRFFEVGLTDNETRYASLISTSLSGPDLSKPAERKDFPLSPSQPTISGIPSTLNRAFSLPEKYTANNNVVSKRVLQPMSSFPRPMIEGCTPRLYGTYPTSVDPHSGRMIPRPSSEQLTASDSIVTIRPCYMVAAGGSSDTENHSNDRAYNDSSCAVTALSGEYGISQTAD